ncbi:MAG: DUF4157 domain-containing protein [Novosphingobium sp.]
MKAQARLKVSAASPAGLRAANAAARPATIPHRGLMISRFGAKAAHVPVVVGPAVAESLRRRGARAASYDGVVFLPHEAVGPDLVAHEVAHALQQIAGGADALAALADPALLVERLAHAPVLPEHARAETEALLSENTAEAAAVSPQAVLPPGVVSLRRPGEVPSGDVAPARSEPPAATAPAPAAPSVAAATPAPATNAPAAAPQAGESDIAPTFAPPAFVEPTLDPALAAQREAEAVAARDALAAADSPEAVMTAYAAMQPSVQAQVQPELGARLAAASATSNAGLAEATPAITVESRGGDGPLPMPAPVAVPADAAAIDLGDAAQPDMTVPAGPEQPVFSVDPGYGPGIERRFNESSTPERVGESIDEVSTRNPGIETRVTDRADVPVDGANDPQRLNDALASQREQASALRQEAALAVTSGPGPEQVVPRALAVSAPAPEFPAPQLEGLQPSPEAQRLQQLALPEAVVANFDQSAAAQMQASAATSREEMAAAQQTRDLAHDDAVRQAEADRQLAEQTADQSQRQAVSEQRDAIQGKRQETVDEQNRQMAGVNAEAAQARDSKRQEAQAEVDRGQRDINARYDQAEHDAEAEVRSGEEQAERERERKRREAEDQSWWDRAVNFIKDAFNALMSLVNRIFDAVRSAVTGLIDLARRAVVGLIEAVSHALQALVSVLGEVLKGLVDGLIGQIFPELARALDEAIDSAVNAVNHAIDVVAGALTTAVNAVAAALTTAVNAALNAFQGAINTALGALQAALTGDWGALLTQILDAVLSVLGIDPAAFHALIAQASDAIDIIVNDPGQFVSNLIDVVVGGVQLFADHFGEHLRRGIVGWLTGALGDIQIPDEWNLMTVLDLARQIMGLTWDFVRERATRLIGAENVARIEMMASWIGTLITEGWAGLWNRIQESLAALRDGVLASIREFVMERVVMASIRWLASLFNPVGALVQLVMTIWNIYQFVSAQAQRLFGIAQAVVGAISNIAHGVLDPGKQAVEGVLGSLVPVVIDLLMSLLGVTGVAARVREIIQDLRQRIADAVDALLQRVLGTLGLGGGAAAGADAAGGAAGQIGHPVRIDVAEGEDHTLTIDRGGAGGATVMLHSDPRPLGQWLDTLAGLAARESDAAKKVIAERKIGEARALLNRLDPLADQAAAAAPAAAPAGPAARSGRGGRAASASPTASTAGASTEAATLEDQLGPILKLVFDNVAGATGAFVERFTADLARAHPQAQEMIRRDLRAHAAEWQTLADWAAVSQRLKSASALFTDPLDSSRTFGGLARTALEATVPAEHEGLKARILTLVRQKVRDGASDAEYVALKTALHEAILSNNLGGATAAMATAARKVAAELNASGDVDPELRNQVTSLGLEAFLLAMGRNQTVGAISPTRFDELWHAPGGANKEFIASRFRLPSGAHEWIPTNYIPNVLAAARSAAQEEGIEAAAFWVKVHDEWRSDTDVLIYKPDTGWARHITVSGQPVTILQGHVGAVYASADDSGVAPAPQQQTIGQGPWHDELRAIFDANVSVRTDSKTAIRNVINQVEAYSNRTLWRGGALSGLDERVFDDYYASNRSTKIGVRGLGANAARSLSLLAADFALARGVVA